MLKRLPILLLLLVSNAVKADDWINDKLDKAKTEYSDVAEKANADLIAAFDSTIKEIAKTGNLDAVKTVLAEKKSFETDGKLPNSQTMKQAVADYQKANDIARKAMIAAYETAVSDYTKALQIEKAEAIKTEYDAFKKPKTQDDTRLEENNIIAGKGWNTFHVGAKRDELVKAFGQPDDGSTSTWLNWGKKYHMHCVYDDNLGASELRFDPGFKYSLPTGIGIDSSEQKLRTAYGKPSIVTDAGNGAKKFEFADKGILFWTNQGKITQIVIFKPY